MEGGKSIKFVIVSIKNVIVGGVFLARSRIMRAHDKISGDRHITDVVYNRDKANRGLVVCCRLEQRQIPLMGGGGESYFGSGVLWRVKIFYQNIANIVEINHVGVIGRPIVNDRGIP